MDEAITTWEAICVDTPDPSSTKLYNGGLQFLKDIEKYEWDREEDPLTKSKITILKVYAVNAISDYPNKLDYNLTRIGYKKYYNTLYEDKLKSTQRYNLISMIVCVLIVIQFVYKTIINIYY